MSVVIRVLASVLALVVLSSCGGGSQTLPVGNTPNIPNENGSQMDTPVQYATEFPSGLPQDAVQPWEELGSDGKVMSATGASSEFFAGTQSHTENGDTEAYNGALRMASGDVGADNLSYAMYRIPLGGSEPGVVSVDANVRPMIDGNIGGYYVGLADYGNNSWQWFGPVDDAHWRISAVNSAREAATLTTDLGNVFVCVVAHDGAAINVVGVGVDPVDVADATAPDAPTNLDLTPVAGGIELVWTAVGGSDVAGYKVHYDDKSFGEHTSQFVNVVEGLHGRSMILDATAQTYVAVSAVDKSGNESAISAVQGAMPLTGDAPVLGLEIDTYSTQKGLRVILTATGADTYDWDTDGDGVFDIMGDATGTADVDTRQTGLIRPLVRGIGADSSSVAMSAVSVIVTSNARPVAVAKATPAFGDAPLAVTLTGTASTDFDGTIVGGGWDYNGDGNFTDYSEIDLEFVTNANHTYDTPGIYNAKLKVVDDEGAWDVDTVAIVVSEPAAPGNNPPIAAVTVGTGEESGDAPLMVNLDASASSDPDTDAGDSIAEYHWDLDGDGMYDGMTTTATYTYTYTTPGIFDAEVLVKDTHGATDTATVEISVGVAGNDSPVASFTATPSAGDAPLVAAFDASGSTDSDGTIVRYDWDMDYDGNFEIYDGGATPTWTYTTPDYHNPVVRVTDNVGAQNTASVAVTARGWRYTEFGNSDPDDEISMIVVDGNPAIACEYDDSPAHTTYRRANDALGLDPWSVVQNPAENSSYNDVSLAIVNGNPAIAYRGRDWTGGTYDSRLYFVRGVDAQGSTWGTPVEVVAEDSTGYDPRLAIVDGNPAIVATYDDSSHELRYYRATDANGTAWGAHVVLATGDNSAYPGALMMADGYPAVVYQDYANDEIDYIRATDPQGTAWGAAQAIVTLDDPSDYPFDPHAAIVDGNPAVVYAYREDDPGNTVPIDDDIRYIRATDAAGTTWGTPVVVADNSWDVDDMGNMVVINGNPAFVFEWDDGDCVIYCRANDATGSTWGPMEHVDPWNWTLYDDLCLAEVDGHPAVAYHYTREPNDGGYGMLKYAIKIE